tara:strand:+ start:8522 stop:8755 length:234 start_codon:yes stop_codon:yes gene_type:complete
VSIFGQQSGAIGAIGAGGALGQLGRSGLEAQRHAFINLFELEKSRSDCYSETPIPMNKTLREELQTETNDWLDSWSD